MAAEEVVGSLAVKLALQSGGFDTGMRRVGTELKSIDSGFRATGAEAAAAGEKFDTLGQKQTALTQKLDVQQSATRAYREQLDELKAKMERLGASQTKYKEDIFASSNALEQAKEELKEHKKAGDLSEEEMKALAQRVEDLGKEYKDLTTKQKQNDSSMASLQGRISKTENAYNEMRVQTAKTRQELARTEAEIKTQASVWGKLQAAAEKAQKPLEKAGKALNTAGNTLTVGLTLPITAALYEAGDAAMDFEDQLAKVGTLPGVTAAKLKSIGSDLIAISNDTNTAVDSLTEAEYQAISAGVDVANSTDYISTSAKAAKGGFTDLTTAVNGNTSVLNAWGLEASASTDVYNKMIVAQNFGKTTLGEIAGSIGNVASTAAGLNVSYTELLAASAAMTKGGISTSESMTMLNQVLASVLNPTAEAQKTAKKLGLEFDATAIKSKGLAGFIGDISEKAGGNEEAMASLFGSVEAYKAVAALAGEQSDDFAEALDAMENSAGAVDAAFNTVSDTTGNKARAALNRVKNAALEFGDAMLPMVGGMLDKVDGLIDGLNEMDDATRKNLLLGAGAVAAIGPATKALGGLATGLSKISGIMTAVKAAGGISGTLGLIGIPLLAGAGAIAISTVIGKIVEMNSESAKITDRVMNIKLNLDDQSQADFDAKVNDITVNTKRVMEIEATVDAEKTDLAMQLENAITDGKFTRGENNKLRKAIDAWVDDAIAGVKEDTATKATEMATALESIAGLSDESKAKIVQTVEANGDKQIEELQGYQDELNTLLSSMRSGTEAITADKIARYNELLTLIATMKAEIQSANEGLASYYEAQQTYINSGQASAEQIVSYTKLGQEVIQNNYNNSESERKQRLTTYGDISTQKTDWRDELLAEKGIGSDDYLVKTTIQYAVETEMQNQQEAAEQVKQDMTATVNEGADAAIASVDNGDNRMGEMLENYMLLGLIGSNNSDFSAKMTQAANDAGFSQAYTDAINQVLGTAYSPEMMEAKNVFGDLSREASNKLKSSITDELETGDWDTATTVLKQIMDGMDPSEVDTSKLSETVKGLFAMTDFVENGGEVTKNIWQGMANGLTENYGIASDAMTEKSNELITLVKAIWGIQSPSTVMEEMGKFMMEGLHDGIVEGVGSVTDPFQTLVDTDFPKLGTDMMNALTHAINSRGVAFRVALMNNIRTAMNTAQMVANKGIKIPVYLDYSNAATKKLSQELGL